jgi:hypothetical protein
MPDNTLSQKDIKLTVDYIYEQITKIDRIATAVVKCHLEVEEQLHKTLEALARSPKYLDLTDYTGFARKMQWLRAFGPLGDNDYWQLIEALNNLRNKVAHESKGPKRDEALQELRNQLNRHLKGDECVSDQNTWKDFNVIMAASVLSIGFLCEIREQIQKERLGES